MFPGSRNPFLEYCSPFSSTFRFCQGLIFNYSNTFFQFLQYLCLKKVNLGRRAHFWSVVLSLPYPVGSTRDDLQLFQFLHSLCPNKSFCIVEFIFGILSSRPLTRLAPGLIFNYSNFYCIINLYT